MANRPVSYQKTKTSRRSITMMILSGVLFSCCLVEALAHLFPQLIPGPVQSVFQNEEDQPLKGLSPDQELGYKYAPNLEDYPVPFEGDDGREDYHISTVGLGYTGTGFRDDGLAGPAEVVVVGDSYASCASVEMEECWVELLEQELGQDFANLGVVGYGPQQEQRMLSQYGLPLQPRLVLWVFFANDLDDAWQFEQFGTGAVGEGEFWQSPVRAWLARHARVYGIGAFFWYNRYLFANLVRADGELVPRDSNLIWWLTNTNLAVPQVARGFALTQEAILAARAQTEQQGAQFILVILPFREQVYAPPGLQPRLDGLNEALLDFGRQQEITVIDLTPALRARAAGRPEWLYFRKDIHLNVQGNVVVAELLNQELNHPKRDD